MLLPRFSIRWTLSLTAVSAVLFVIARQAVLGHQWAIAISGVLVLLVCSFLMFGAAFLLAYGLARATRSLSPPESPSNPFVVDGQYPPQMVPKNPVPDQQ